MKKLINTFVLLLVIGMYSFSQENLSSSDSIQTASEFFEETIASKYAGFEDIKVKLTTESSAGEFQGTMFIKQPNKFRINFTKPIGQVVNSNGKDFYMYIPSQNVALHQKKRNIGGNSGSTFTNAEGLSQLAKNYVVTYFDKPEYVVYENDSSKRVMMLNLMWKTTSQNFRSLILYIGKDDHLIYRVDAITYNKEQVKFIFSDFEINKGIPDSRFEYDPPATAHVMDKFLFDEEKDIQNE